MPLILGLLAWARCWPVPHRRAWPGWPRWTVSATPLRSRILRSAIETTEFVGHADVIWVRDTEPPDVDYKNYDLWMMVDLYASDSVQSRYREWSDSVADCRAILDEVPEERTWYDMDEALQDRFRSAKQGMDSCLSELLDEARRDLSGRDV